MSEKIAQLNEEESRGGCCFLIELCPYYASAWNTSVKRVPSPGVLSQERSI